MSSRKTIKSFGRIACAVALASSVAVPPVHAGPLCDWLCGRTPPPAVPTYAVGYPVMQAPVVQGAYSAQMPVVQAQPLGTPTWNAAPGVMPASGYAANYAPTNGYVPNGYASSTPLTTGTQYLPGASTPIGSASPVGATGTNALQMPGYSAYYGAAQPIMPNDRGYAAVSPMPGQQLQNSGYPSTSFTGTGNTYPTYPGSLPTTATVPSTPYGVAPVAAYYPSQTAYYGTQANAWTSYAPQATAPVGVPMPSATAVPTPGVPITNPTGVPIAAPPGSTVQTYPGIPASRPGILGGLSRFFGGMFGTQYSTSYYRAPVTYYRPVTTVDATTGAPQTVQRACTSYEYQLQRTPTASFCPCGSGNPAGATSPGSSCCSSNCGSSYNPYLAPTTIPSPATQLPPPPSSGVAPTNYYGPPVSTYPERALGNAPGLQGYSQSAVPQPYGNSMSSESAPGTGGTTPGNGVSNPDLAPVNPPQLGPQSSSNYSPPSMQQPALSAPSLLQPSGAADALGTRNGEAIIKPIPANGYPYQRSDESSAPKLQLPPPPSDPVATTGMDRVAAAENGSSWGYKTIQWNVRPASFQSVNPRESAASQASQTSTAMRPPVYLRSFPPAEKQRESNPNSSSASTPPTKAGAGQYDAYQSTGWTRSGR